jgi:hypothetical protein
MEADSSTIAIRLEIRSSEMSVLRASVVRQASQAERRRAVRTSKQDCFA